MSRKDEIFQGLYKHTLEGRSQEVKNLTEEGLRTGQDPMEMLFDALIPALEEVGRRFEIGEYFVPEMMVSAKAMQTAMNILRPLLAETGAKPVGKVLMFTVKGDLHDIGKNLCDIMLEGAGFEVVDLGVNVRPDQMLAGIREHGPHLVGMSAFLTTTMPNFKVNLRALELEGWRDKVKVMVGGAPVTEEFSGKVGADGYARDASGVVKLARRLMSETHLEGEAALESSIEAT